MAVLHGIRLYHCEGSVAHLGCFCAAKVGVCDEVLKKITGLGINKDCAGGIVV
jgi:hypothetical protein